MVLAANLAMELSTLSENGKEENGPQGVKLSVQNRGQLGGEEDSRVIERTKGEPIASVKGTLKEEGNELLEESKSLKRQECRGEA